MPSPKFRICLFLFALFLSLSFSATTLAQIYNLSELNTEQIRALDRQKTVVLLPGGILEEHGPYLPSYTDGYAIAAITQELARAIVSRPGWKVLLFPQIPLGHNGANAIGGKHAFPGTYTVRHSTLRAVYMDLAGQFGDQGFRWIFIVHDHGDPDHNKALDEASDFFTDSYGGAMVHLMGLKPISECCGTAQKFLTPEQIKENGILVHADANETSQMMFLRPDLVRPDVLQAPSWTGQNFVELYTLAEKPNWPGYLGAPKFASAALGAQSFQALTGKINETAVQLLDGLNWRKIPRFADDVDPRDAQGEAAAAANDRNIEKKQLDWMKAHNIAPTP
jgi:creatinine amidohydrolase/Fe(II)-dependent formamide hydrolase-like protein